MAIDKTLLLTQRIEEMQTVIDAKNAALAKFGRHDDSCCIWKKEKANAFTDCDCGFNAAFNR